MADAVVEPERNHLKFFCHRCNVEIEEPTQNHTCPFCSSGFIECIETNQRGTENEYSDADMSNVGDAGGPDRAQDESSEGSNNQNQNQYQVPRVLSDLALLMSGRARPGDARLPRSETLMEQLVLMIGGNRAPGAVTAGAPFVLVGAPGDYVFGGEGLDAVVTQLLGQLENTGPPPLPTEQISMIACESITAAQVEASLSCSVCWDVFTLGESVSRLECDHIFHAECIFPWLRLHATCPICRRNLLPEPSAAPPAPAPQTPAPQTPATTGSESAGSGTNAATSRTDSEASAAGTSQSISDPYYTLQRRVPTRTTRIATDVDGLWAHITTTINDDSTSLSSSDAIRFLDIEID